MSGPTALLYPNGIIKCPWQYRKINGTWCRRPVNTNSPWQALTTTLVGRPSDSGNRKGPDNKQLPSIYRWDWK